MSYYPTKVGVQHPALNGRDMLGEQIEALHRQGIRAPIYTTLVWEEYVAQMHPEWRQLKKDGTFAGWVTSANQIDMQPGVWKFLNFLHPEYQDYFEAHIREICANYDVDGIFVDILYMDKNADWSEHGVAFREKHGLMAEDYATQETFHVLAKGAFAEKFSKIIKGLEPEATIFYNANNVVIANAELGKSRTRHMTHLEIESLPSGFWGYYHFPRNARGSMNWGMPWLGMTGRFQKMWGDFGGIKPQPALEYECFRSQALGGASSVGDQLPPRGRLDAAAYDLIGAVYEQWEAAEPFYENSQPIAEVGILTSQNVTLNPIYEGKSDEGVTQMCEEAHYECTILDDECDLSCFPLLILPDTTVITPSFKQKLEAYYKNGGKLILSYHSCFDENEEHALDFLPLSFHGEVDKYPTYWRAKKDFSADMSRSDRVFYQAGIFAKGGAGTQVLVDRVLPYFKRTDVKFSSHFQTPPVAEPCEYPAVIAGERFIYFSDPIFREYRQAGNIAVRDIWLKAMHQLLGPAMFGGELPKTMNAYPRRRGNDLIITLLHYIPVRKALDIDMIEERSSFAGEKLQIAGNPPMAKLYPHGDELPKAADGAFILPAAKGRLLIEVADYYSV